MVKVKHSWASGSERTLLDYYYALEKSHRSDRVTRRCTPDLHHTN